MDANRLWWVAYALNTSCCTVDLYKLKKAGYQTGKLMLGVLFLIPLYIYKRMKMVSGKKWFAAISMMIWTVVFIINLWIPDMFWVKVVGLSNPAVITSVQTGFFYSYPDVEVGKLFNKAVDYCEWDTYTGADREVLVRVSGELEGYQLETIFKMKIDNSFEIFSMRLDDNQCSTEEINGMPAYLYESYRQ